MAGGEGFVLQTGRTTIRPWRTSEAERLLDIRRRPDVAEWLGSPEPWTDTDQALEHLQRWRDQATAAVPSSCAIVPDDTGVPVGTVTLVRMPGPGAGGVALAEATWLDEFAPLGGVDGRPGEVEVGWYLHPGAHGNGWATEAAAAMLAHGFAHGIDRVWAVMWPHNVASAAVCRRLGMAELGVRVDPWYGTPADPDSRFFLATPSRPTLPPSPASSERPAPVSGGDAHTRRVGGRGGERGAVVE